MGDIRAPYERRSSLTLYGKPAGSSDLLERDTSSQLSARRHDDQDLQSDDDDEDIDDIVEEFKARESVNALRRDTQSTATTRAAD